MLSQSIHYAKKVTQYDHTIVKLFCESFAVCVSVTVSGNTFSAVPEDS